MGTSSGPSWGSGQARLVWSVAAAFSRLAQHGAAVHAGAFLHGLALQGVWCQRNVLPAQPETCGLLQPEKLGGSWHLWQHRDPSVLGRVCVTGDALWLSGLWGNLDQSSGLACCVAGLEGAFPKSDRPQ